MSIKRTSCILFLFICTRSLWIKRHLLTQNVMQISGKRSNCLRHHLGCYRDVRTPDVNTMLLYLCKTLNYLKDVIIHLLHIYTASFIFFIFIKGDVIDDHLFIYIISFIIFFERALLHGDMLSFFSFSVKPALYKVLRS